MAVSRDRNERLSNGKPRMFSRLNSIINQTMHSGAPQKLHTRRWVILLFVQVTSFVPPSITNKIRGFLVSFILALHSLAQYLGNHRYSGIQWRISKVSDIQSGSVQLQVGESQLALLCGRLLSLWSMLSFAVRTRELYTKKDKLWWIRRQLIRNSRTQNRQPSIL